MSSSFYPFRQLLGVIYNTIKLLTCQFCLANGFKEGLFSQSNDCLKLTTAPESMAKVELPLNVMLFQKVIDFFSYKISLNHFEAAANVKKLSE